MAGMRSRAIRALKFCSAVVALLLVWQGQALAQDIAADRIQIGGCRWQSGSGSPEGVVTGSPCDTYWRTDASLSNPAIYVKLTGTGTTGWAALGTVTSVAGRTGAVTLTAADVGTGTFAAGDFTFQNTVFVNGSLRVGTGAYSAGAGDAAFSRNGAPAAGAAYFGNSGNSWLYFDGSSTWYLAGGDLIPFPAGTGSLGLPSHPWKSGYISTLNSTVYAQNVQQLFAGTNVIGKSAGAFAAAVASGDAVIDFGQAMTPNDFVLVQANDASGAVKAEWIKVLTLVGGTTYNVERDKLAANAPDPAWAIGTAYLVSGHNGDTRIVMSAGASPKISFGSQGANAGDYTEVVSISPAGIVTPTFTADAAGARISAQGSWGVTGGLAITSPDSGTGDLYGMFTDFGIIPLRKNIGLFSHVTTAGSGLQAGAMIDALGPSGSKASKVEVYSKGGWAHGTWTAGNITTDALDDGVTPTMTVGAGAATLNLGSSATTKVTERGRSYGMGEAQDIPYNGANFTGSAGTWTVEAGDQITLKWMIVGRTMTMWFALDATTVAAPGNELRIAIPYVTPAFAAANTFWYADNGGADEIGIVVVSPAGGGILRLFRTQQNNWTASTNATRMWGQITFGF